MTVKSSYATEVRTSAGYSTDQVSDTPQRSSHLYEQIHKILWDKILTGEIVPGDRLKDIDWATRLGVSRTPVREAIRKMQQEGILLPLSNGGHEVRQVSPTDLQELYHCRGALEGLAVREAAKGFTSKAAKQFERLIKRADEAIAAGDLDRAFHLNTEFHWSLIEFSGNSHLIGLCESLRKLVIFYRSARLSRGKSGNKAAYLERLRIEQDDHRAIIAALADRDGDKAAALMEGHLQDIALAQ